MTRRALSADERSALDKAAEEFAKSDLARELATQEGAAGRCKPAALAALGLLRERGLDAALVRLDRRNEHHWIVAVGEVAFDPSARQFADTFDAKVPRVV